MTSTPQLTEDLPVTTDKTIKKITDHIEVCLETLSEEDAISVLESVALFCTDKEEDLRDSADEDDEDEDEDEEDE
jgi:hypothetical protein